MSDNFLEDDQSGAPVETQINPKPAEKTKTNPANKTEKQGPITKVNPEPVVETSVREIKRKTGSRLPAELPVSERAAPPITRRKFAIYNLIAFDNVFDGRADPPFNRIEPQPYELVSTYVFYDPFEEVITNRQKVLQFTTGVERFSYTDAKGQNQHDVRNKFGVPEFPNGVAVCDTEKNYLQYLWYELHPRLEGGKYQDKTKQAWFRRVDTQHSNPYLKVVDRNLKLSAEQMIVRMSVEQRRNLAAALNIPTTLSAVDMEIHLREFATMNRVNAERVMFTAPDQKATIKLKIAESVEAGILDFHEDLKVWMFSSDVDPLLTVLEGQDPLDDLAAFFAKDGINDYKEVLKQLDHFKS